LHQVLGRRMRELAPQHEEHWFQIYGQVALTGQPVRFENFAEKLDRRWFDVHASRVGGPTSRKVALLFTDITKRKLAEEALRKAQGELREYAATLELTVNQRTAQLREKIGELETFSYSVSHDMRAPLRSMQGFAQILREEFAGQWQPEPQDLLLRIEKAAERLDHLIQDMLTYSQVTRGETALSSINLLEVVNQVMQAYPGFRVAQIEIAVSSVRVQGNHSALTQCISNLLGNAIKFVAPGRQARVKIWTEPRGESIRLWIEDNGIGIPPEFHKKIFELFTRVHERSDYEGTGIGLSIVKKAVEKMGGQVGVESEPDQGSRFWLELAKA
jgi:signal transduction histidine kinase